MKKIILLLLLFTVLIMLIIPTSAIKAASPANSGTTVNIGGTLKGEKGDAGAANMTAGAQGVQGIPGERNMTPNMTAGAKGDPGTTDYLLLDNLPDLTQYLFLNGTRTFTGILNLGEFNLSNLFNPEAAQDAATKDYVDTAVASATGGDTSQFFFLNGTRTLTGNIEMWGFRLTNITSNNGGGDAVNRTYVNTINTSMLNNVSANFAPIVNGLVPTANLGGNGASSTTYLRGDQTWAAPTGSSLDTYTLPIMSLTTSPADSVSNYMGNRPIAPTTTANSNKIFIPASGTIKQVHIYEYSGTAGTAENYGYWLMLNNINAYAISNLSISANERLFNNTNMNVPVNAGDYVEIRRLNALWATNPLTTIVGGFIVVNTTVPTLTPAGYTLPVMALTSSPGDANNVWFGNLPKVPQINGSQSKVFIPTSGTIKRAEIYCYSGTAGTAERWNLSVQVNNATQYLIQDISASSAERIFHNATINIPIVAGDYIEIESHQPTWVTNPATTIYGGYVYVE